MNRAFLSTFVAAVFLLGASCIGTKTAEAQLVASEASSITQTVDGTVMTVAYSRPSRRGRSPLFGGVMAYGQIITPGANAATTFEFSKDVKIEGTRIPAGKYSVWIAFEEGEWDVLLDETWQRFHGPHLVREEAEYSFSVTPRDIGLEMETLTFHFPTVRSDGAILRLHWGTTAVDMNIEVEPTPMVNITAADAAKYVGTYTTDITQIPPFTMYSGTGDIELRYSEGFLQTTVNIGPETTPHDLAFYPQTELVLFPVLLIEGVAAQSFQGGVLFEFTDDSSGGITGFEARLADDTLWLKGTKTR